MIEKTTKILLLVRYFSYKIDNLLFYRGTCVAAYHLYTKRNTLKDGENGKASIATLRYGVSG